MRCGFAILGFTYQISGHSQGFFRNKLEMAHRVSPRLTVYSVGAVGLIMSAVGGGAASERGAAVALASMAASVAVSSGPESATGPAASATGVGSSMGRECPANSVQPLTEIAAANTATDRVDLKTWLKVILPSSTMGWGSSTAVIIGCGAGHTTYCQVCALDPGPTRAYLQVPRTRA